MKRQGRNLTSTPKVLFSNKHPITKIQNLLYVPLPTKLKPEMPFYENLMKHSVVKISVHSNFDQFLINLVTMVTGLVPNCDIKEFWICNQFTPLTGFNSAARRLACWQTSLKTKQKMISSRWLWVKTAGRFVLSWKHTQLCDDEYGALP